MPTVIDSLVLELGMDTRKLSQDEREALTAFEHVKGGMREIGDSVQAGGAKISETFALLKGGIGGIIATLVGAAVGHAVDQVVRLDATTSRLARSLGVGTRELSVWQGIMRQMGGSAEQANAAFTNLGDTLEDIKMGVATPSGPFLHVMNLMGLSAFNATPEQVMQRLPGFVDQQRAAGRSDADIRFLLRNVPGVGGNEPMLQAILQGKTALDEFRKTAEATTSATEETGKAAQRVLQAEGAIESAMQDVVRRAIPSLRDAIDTTTGIFKNLNDFVGGGLLGGGDGLKAESPKDESWFARHGGRDLWGALIGGDWDAAKRIWNQLKSFVDTPAHGEAPSRGIGDPAALGAQRGEVEQYIRDAASKRGIDPDVAVQVAKSESSLNPAAVGDRGTSFGVFQLHTGGGLGDKFGPGVQDPATWRAQVDFALDEAMRQGWGPWHGWRGLPRAGLPPPPPASPGAKERTGEAPKPVTVNIGNINVSSSKADPQKVAAAIPDAMKIRMAGAYNTGAV